MTIGKKLYVNFGIILTTVLVLFLVNWSAVQREHRAKELADTTNAVRFQMMQNRLYLSNYLLSGDTREVDRMNEGLRALKEKLSMEKPGRLRSGEVFAGESGSNWSSPGERNLPSR